MLHLLPYPRSLRMEEGSVTLPPDLRIVLSDRSFLKAAAEQLQAEICAACGFRPAIVPGSAGIGDILLQNEFGGPDGPYQLRISPEGVTIRAGSHAGVISGVQTLRQIIRQCGWVLPCLVIEDKPVYEARGFYHDVTRGRVPTLAWLKHLADEMCFYKLNQLQLYVEHTYLFRDLTELRATAVTPLTAEEIMELDDYCFARGIELVPSLSTFGHLLELLRTKRFAHLCEMPDSDLMPSTMPARMAHHTIDPSNPESLRLVLSMIDEYMALFRSRKFNICADETFDLGKGRNQGKDERMLYMGFVRALCSHVAECGHTPMFWGDIVVRFADALSELPEGTVCLNWGYSPEEKEDSTRILAQAGAIQYVCPGVCGWNQWMPRIRDSYENIRRLAAYGAKYGAVGLLNTDWGDYGHINDPRFSLPGMIFGACASWSGELLPFGDLCRSISCLAYGDRSGRAVEVIAGLEQARTYDWWQIVRYKDSLQGFKLDVWAQPEGKPADEARFAAGQQRIAQIAQALRELCLQMDTSQRPMLARWLTAAEAMRLWDRAYHMVCCGVQDDETALAMERWLKRYEDMWREVSRESELWRIRDVTVWYADRLRTKA